MPMFINLCNWTDDSKLPNIWLLVPEGQNKFSVVLTLLSHSDSTSSCKRSSPWQYNIKRIFKFKRTLLFWDITRFRLAAVYRMTEDVNCNAAVAWNLANCRFYFFLNECSNRIRWAWAFIDFDLLLIVVD